MSSIKRLIFSRGIIEDDPIGPPLPEGSKVGSGALQFGTSYACGNPGSLMTGSLFLEQNVRDWIGSLTEDTTPPPSQYFVTAGLNFPANGWYRFATNPSNNHRIQILNGYITKIEFC